MLEIDIKLLPFQGVNNERALPQGVASLALGYALHWGFQPALAKSETSVLNNIFFTFVNCNLRKKFE